MRYDVCGWEWNVYVCGWACKSEHFTPAFVGVLYVPKLHLTPHRSSENHGMIFWDIST